MNILYIEDNEGDIRLVADIIKEIDPSHYITIINDGQKAIDFLDELKQQDISSVYDLILLDLNLPGVDGSTVLSHIVNDEILMEIPVVILAGFSPFIEKCADLGAFACFEKGFEYNVLVERIKQILTLV